MANEAKQPVLTIAMLKAEATKKGLSFKSKATKSDLLSLLATGKTVAKVGKSFAGEY